MGSVNAFSFFLLPVKILVTDNEFFYFNLSVTDTGDFMALKGQEVENTLKFWKV